jgi:hypothetical protein
MIAGRSSTEMLQNGCELRHRQVFDSWDQNGDQISPAIIFQITEQICAGVPNLPLANLEHPAIYRLV